MPAIGLSFFNSQFIILQVSVTVRKYTVFSMFQGIFHYVDFEEGCLRTGLTATQIAHHVGRLQTAFLKQAAESGEVVFLSVGKFGHVDGFYTV